MCLLIQQIRYNIFYFYVQKNPFKSLQMNQTYINFQYYQENSNLIIRLWSQNFVEGNS